MEFKQATLPNGLRIITSKTPGFLSASVAVFTNAGSRNEREDNGGIAHALEHLFFKSTKNRSTLQIAREVEDLGSSVNAYTSENMTCYYVKGLGKNVRQSVEILGDMMTNPLYDPKDIDIERGVIDQEINMYLDDPMSLAYDAHGMLMYPNQALGRPILGKAEFIAKFNRDHLIEFVSQNYDPSNMIVAGMGNIDHDEFVKLVEDNFSLLPRRDLSKSVFEPAVYGGGVNVNRTNRFEQVSFVLGYNGASVKASNLDAHQLLPIMLGGGMSSPLFQEVREKRGLVYGVGAYAAHERDYGFMMITAKTTGEHVEELCAVVKDECTKMCECPMFGDLNRAKNAMLVNYSRLLESPFSLGEYAVRSIFNHGKILDMDARIARIEEVTVRDIERAAMEVFSTKPTISIVGPAPHIDYEAAV